MSTDFMLVRIDGELREVPDDVGVAIIADPTHGDNVSDWNAKEVNVLLHGTVGILHDVFGGDEVQSIDEYVQAIRNHFASISAPTEAQLEQARCSVEVYKREIKEDDVGMVDPNEMFQFQQPGDLTRVIEGPDPRCGAA